MKKKNENVEEKRKNGKIKQTKKTCVFSRKHQST
jgi:hypothetical protein